MINPTSFQGAVVDVAPLTNGGAMVTVLPVNNQPAGGGGIGGNPGGIVPQPQPMPMPGANQLNFKLFQLKGSTEMDLGVGARAANGGYAEFDPENKRLFVSSWRDKGLDVYEVTDADAANGLKLKSSIKTAKGESLGGHFFVAPDGKSLVFHTGVVIDTNNVSGGGGVVPPPGGGGVVPPPGGKPPGGKPNGGPVSPVPEK